MSQKPLSSDTRPMLTSEEMIAMKNALSDFITYILGELREKVDNRKDYFFMYSFYQGQWFRWMHYQYYTRKGIIRIVQYYIAHKLNAS